MLWIIGTVIHGPTAIMLAVVYGCVIMIMIALAVLFVRDARKKEYWVEYLKSDESKHYFKCAVARFHINRQLGEQLESVFAEATSRTACFYNMQKGQQVYIFKKRRYRLRKKWFYKVR